MSFGASVEQKVARISSQGIFSPLEAKSPLDEDRKRRKILFLSGPTGCGKTELSLLLAAALDAEIISADAMQVYRGMDIGTAKATYEQRNSVPHHLIDIRNVDEPFNVVDFYYEAQNAIERIIARGKIPLIVGGAGFYLHTLIYGPPGGPPSVTELRARLESELEEQGAHVLYERLSSMDPDYAATITPSDRHKIVRALEILVLTGFPVSSLSWRSRTPSIQGAFRCWFLFRPRPSLYCRVEKRCEEMIEAGFIEEVIELERQGLRKNPTASHAIGYRQCLEYLSSPRTEGDLRHFIEAFKQASRHYIKRQFTWFRREPLFQWLDAETHDTELLVDLLTQDIRGC